MIIKLDRPPLDKFIPKTIRVKRLKNNRSTDSSQERFIKWSVEDLAYT